MIKEDKQGNIWIVDIDNVYKITINNSGNITNIEALSNHPFFKTHRLKLLRCLFIDPLWDFVWLGSSVDGLYRIQLEKDKKLDELAIDQFKNGKKDKKTVSSNFISSITRLPNGELWLGTESGGICKVLNCDQKPEFITFSEDQGLSNNVVKSILYDKNSNLWISTNIGLNKFDVKTSQFRKFSEVDGLPFKDFYYASTKLDNGLFVFSGLDGFCYFSPDNIPEHEILPKVKIGELKIYNKTVVPGDTINGRVILEKRLMDTNELILKHNENVFSLELTSLHFSSVDSHHLRYQLLPINNNWIEVQSNQRTINYNGLQPGKYQFNYLASNSLNQWTEIQSLNITIKPPFWVTIPAFILYFLLIGVLIYAIMYYIFRMNRLKYKLEIESLEKQNITKVNAAKLRFFSNISHEIKTPLTLISGSSELMTQRYKGNQELVENLNIVQRQSKKIWQLIDQVHDFQRSDANKLKMNYSLFCVNDFFKELMNDFYYLASIDKKKLTLINRDTPIYILADMDKLEKILNNLLNNAFKYTKANDSITVEYNATEKDLLIIVSDTGKGINSEDLPHIFKRFYQSNLKNNQYIGGSGIGLAFSKRLVEMHYGYISAESILHKGTQMRVKLPVVSDQSDIQYSETKNKILKAEETFNQKNQIKGSIETSTIKVEGGFSQAKIFFAEDNPDMRKFISEVLSNFYKVKAFSNGKEILEAMVDEWPDIVISDVLMPEINGFDICKQIKTDIKTSHIPVILLTACTTIEEQLKGLKVRADSYIKKPFNIQHLVTSIETILENRKNLRNRFQIDFPLTMEKKVSFDNDLSFLEKLYALMEQNIDNVDIDIDFLAKKLYLNRTHFFQKVKALTNETPYELLKIYRLKRAAELLVQKQLSVNEVYSLT